MAPLFTKVYALRLPIVVGSESAVCLGGRICRSYPGLSFQISVALKFELEEECVAYEKIAALLNGLLESEYELAEEKLGLQEGFTYGLRSGFFSTKDFLKYRESFQRFADFLHGRLKLE